MISQDHAERALDFIRDNAPAFAKARAQRIYLEEFRKSKKALLMQMAPLDLTSMAAKEAWAYAQPDYTTLLDGISAAVEEEERLRWLMTAAEVKIEVWRTQEASARRG